MGDNKSSFQESGYSGNQESSFSETFSEVRPIPTTGTTCDAFSARYESRRVFVKRLKGEHASNPRYRTAFKKEYELGISLRHPSIPQYLKFTGDTLVTEFVDGKTLHQMIQEDDPRLHSDRNIEKWVGQLLDVMDYLHSRNVLHCDIKDDNIMITNDTRNLMLIDLDKAFTASQDSTPGTPLNYGTEEEILTKCQMDIRGIGLITESIQQFAQKANLRQRLTQLVNASKNPEMTLPDLVEEWLDTNEPNDKRNPKSIQKNIGWAVSVILLVTAFILVWINYPFDRTSEPIPDENQMPVLEGEGDNIESASEDTPDISVIKEPSGQKKDSDSRLTSEMVAGIIGDDLQPLKKYLQKVNKQLNENNVDYQLAETYDYDLRDLSLQLDYKVIEKFGSYYPTLSRKELLKTIYSFGSVKDVMGLRDEVIDRLVIIKNFKNKGNDIPDRQRVNACIESLNQQVNVEFKPLLKYMSEINGLIDSGEITKDNVNSYLNKLEKLFRECENKVVEKVSPQFPEFDEEVLLATVVTVDSFQPIFNQWSGQQSRLYAILREVN